MHYICQNALRLLKCITSVKMHYICQNALHLFKCITSVKMHYDYVNSDLALLPYISAFYKSNSRRSIVKRNNMALYRKIVGIIICLYTFEQVTKANSS